MHLRIVVTFTAALLVSVIGVLWVSARIQRHTIGEFFEGSMKLELQQAQHAYESGGPAALKAYLNQVDGALKGTRFLTDADGVDLVSGLNRSEQYVTPCSSTFDQSTYCSLEFAPARKLLGREIGRGGHGVNSP